MTVPSGCVASYGKGLAVARSKCCLGVVSKSVAVATKDKDRNANRLVVEHQ